MFDEKENKAEWFLRLFSSALHDEKATDVAINRHLFIEQYILMYLHTQC